MPRINVIVAAVLLAGLGVSTAYAGDFVPRVGGTSAALGDDPAARCATADVGPASATSEPEAVAPVSVPSHASTAHRPVRVTADESTSVNHAAPASSTTADSDEKSMPVATHKARAALRWQSLVPGVMK